MKCIKCGIELSEKVLRIHQKVCTVGKLDIRQLAKENKIKSWHNKSLEKIESELKEMGVI